MDVIYYRVHGKRNVPSAGSSRHRGRLIDILPEVRELVRQRVTSMDHVEVLMRLLEAEGKPLTPSELERTARIGPETSVKVLADLVKAGLARHDAPSNSFSYGPFTREDRAAVEALATMYHQRPVTLVKLVYTQPPSAVQSFSDAFRLRGKPGED